MKLTAITIDGFKNLKQLTMEPGAHYNLIVGENAQGKTNFLEAIWMMTGCRSFRGTRERDYLCTDGTPLRVVIRFDDGRREQTLTCEMTSPKDRRFTCNGIPVQKMGELFHAFHCVAFTPEDIALVSGTPEGRRQFLDLSLSQLQPHCLELVRRYQLILSHRNAALRQPVSATQIAPTLDVWDAQLAAVGAALAAQRASYVKALVAQCVPLYQEIAAQREALEIIYHANVYGEAPELPAEAMATWQQQYLQRLLAARETDLQLGFTSVGIHRDELTLRLNGQPARTFGSQGQKKSLALALRLSQAALYAKRYQAAPILLLDDVMGELDAGRQQVVCTVIQDMQVFLTTCHAESLIAAVQGERLYLQNGSRFSPLST
jgi:DNA replication and repair protein RecF